MIRVNHSVCFNNVLGNIRLATQRHKAWHGPPASCVCHLSSVAHAGRIAVATLERYLSSCCICANQEADTYFKWYASTGYSAAFAQLHNAAKPDMDPLPAVQTLQSSLYSSWQPLQQRSPTLERCLFRDVVCVPICMLTKKPIRVFHGMLRQGTRQRSPSYTMPQSLTWTSYQLYKTLQSFSHSSCQPLQLRSRGSSRSSLQQPCLPRPRRSCRPCYRVLVQRWLEHAGARRDPDAAACPVAECWRHVCTSILVPHWLKHAGVMSA